MGKRVFVKFGKKEHLEAIIKGMIRFAPSQLYIKMEEELHNKGQGDLLEGKWIIHSESMKMISDDTGEINEIPYKSKITIGIENVNNIPVFCITEYNDKYISDKGILTVPNDELESIKQGFPKATHALIILEDELFIKAVQSLDGHKIISDRVHYYDYDINDIRMLSYLTSGDEYSYQKGNGRQSMTYKNRYRHLLCKDDSFSNQNEYRFIVLDELSDIPLFYSIEYTGKYKIVEIDDLRMPINLESR
ncbi:hypothetical protein I260019D6_12840 [Dorea longicatena]|uniref:hypothetical protein n=1 Tax=Dorea longicatena TaxID=88431 RepID=UPI0036F3101E